MTTTRPEVLAEVQRIAETEIGLDRPLRLDDDLIDDLQLDSLGLLTLVAGLENRFQFAIPDEATSGVRTVGDLIERVSASLTEAESA